MGSACDQNHCTVDEHALRARQSTPSDAVFGRAARMLVAAGLPARLRILVALREKGACVRGLAARLGVPESLVSQQLGVLRRAGLVVGRRSGRNVEYRVDEQRAGRFVRAALSVAGAAS